MKVLDFICQNKNQQILMEHKKIYCNFFLKIKKKERSKEIENQWNQFIELYALHVINYA